MFLWSDTEVTVQVLTITASASFSTISCPREAASWVSAWVSNKFTLHPRVKKANFIVCSNLFIYDILRIYSNTKCPLFQHKTNYGLTNPDKRAILFP